EVMARPRETVGMRRVAVTAHEPIPLQREDVGDLDDLVLHPAAQPHDLPHPPPTVGEHVEVHDQIDRARHRRHDEAAGDVLPGEHDEQGVQTSNHDSLSRQPPRPIMLTGGCATWTTGPMRFREAAPGSTRPPPAAPRAVDLLGPCPM